MKRFLRLILTAGLLALLLFAWNYVFAPARQEALVFNGMIFAFFVFLLGMLGSWIWMRPK